MKLLFKPLTVISAFLFMGSLLVGCKNHKPSDHDKGTASSEDSTNARINPSRPSPLDSVSGIIDGVEVKIVYSSPAVKGRTIWGVLESYDKIWRTGANEATTISFSEDMAFEGTKVKAGKYALFTIPRKDGPWDLILNKVWDQWGAYNYDETENILQVAVQPIMLEESMENLRFTIDNTGKIVLAWEYIMLPINIRKAENKV